MTESKIGAILLAAGESSRFGEPKQFVVHEGKTLLKRAAELLAASRCSPIVIVTGNEHKRIADELGHLRFNIFRNDDWEAGIGSSIKTGLTHILAIDPNLDAVAITLCDQPFVTLVNIESLCDEFTSSGADIVAAEYSVTRGVPAVFSRNTFGALSVISNDKGAREIIRSGTFSVVSVPVPGAAVDIDTPDDLRILATATKDS